jgi:GAF domain-containing protein
MPTPLRVLIAEDRPTDAELMVYELIRSGFEPKWKRVETEAEYLAELQTAPEVILADHTLPQFDAPRALDLLKKTGLDIPLIVVTGSISEEVAVERIKQGAADYILKDRMTRLGEAVKRALEEKRLRQEKQKADAALQARYQELQTLHKLSQDVLNTIDLQTAVNQILDQAMSVDSFDIGTILLVDPSGKKIEAAAARGYRESANLQRQPREDAPGRSQYRALSYEKTYVVENVAEADGLRTLKKEGIQSAILTPVRAGERTLGFIQVGSRTRRKFDPDKIRLLEAIGNQMGVAIQKARLFEETRRNLERIRALHEIDRAISSTLDLNATLVVLQRIIPKFVPSITASTIRLMDKKSGRLDAASCWNLNEDEWRTHVKTGRMTLADKVFESQKPLKILNVERDPAHPADFARKYGLTSYLGVPLSAKEERLGVLGFYTREEHDFSEDDVEFLVTLAGQAAIAIHNSQLYEETKKQAIELERSNKVKDEFLSVMSHELRTPLNVVMGYTGMIQERMLGEINE